MGESDIRGSFSWSTPFTLPSLQLQSSRPARRFQPRRSTNTALRGIHRGETAGHCVVEGGGYGWETRHREIAIEDRVCGSLDVKLNSNPRDRSPHLARGPGE